MLKSLGATVAQVAQRLGDDASTGLAAGEEVARRAQQRRRRRTVVVLLLAFVLMVVVFSTVFHELMARENQSFSWPSSVYWTLTTMTTLGFGDITFESDAGRIFSVVVLLSGSAFLLVVLPFVFIQFVFIPWMDERERRRAPRSLPPSMVDHLILTQLGPVEEALIDDAIQAEVPYVVIVEDIDEAGRRHDEGRNVMVGPLDDPETYARAQVDQAAMVVADNGDQINTNIAFTVREVAPKVPIVASANRQASVDILEIAGADHVVQLGEVLGAAMANRALGLGGHAQVIGEFDGLQIAEAGVVGTELIGSTLAEAGLREQLGVGLVGLWDRGEFQIARPDSRFEESSVLLLAGSAEQIARFDEHFSVPALDAPRAVILGGGRVGRAVGNAFRAEGVNFAIVEQLAERERPGVDYVIGDAADRSVLVAAGIDEADAILVTTHDDNVNVFLTRYCRGLRPDARIVSRSRLDRNVTTLYRAGADAVLSYAAAGASAIWNQLRSDETLLVAHGLNVFRSPVPDELAGQTLAEAHVHRRTECNVIAIHNGERVRPNPDAHAPLPVDAELVLVATDEAKARFSRVFPHARRRVRLPGSRR